MKNKTSLPNHLVTIMRLKCQPESFIEEMGRHFQRLMNSCVPYEDALQETLEHFDYFSGCGVFHKLQSHMASVDLSPHERPTNRCPHGCGYCKKYPEIGEECPGGSPEYESWNGLCASECGPPIIKGRAFLPLREGYCDYCYHTMSGGVGCVMKEDQLLGWNGLCPFQEC